MKRIWKTASFAATMMVIFMTVFLNRRDIFAICKKLCISILNEKAVSKEQMAVFEEDYKSILQSNDCWINGWGISQKLLLKRDLGDVLCDKQGELYLKDNGTSNEKINEVAASISVLYEYSKDLGIPFLFVQCPYKNYAEIEELQGYGIDRTEEYEDELIERLNQNGVPVLDLREYFSGTVHYLTDHHWTCETAFKANSIIVRYLYEDLGIPLNKTELDFYCDENNYNTVCYPSSFLGSIGIRVGEGYTRKEDFTIIMPDFFTSYHYTHLIKKEVVGSYLGDFEACFIDEALLLNKNYKNKYMSFLRGGYVENVIENENSKSELKALLISHSYGTAMVPYMSLFYKEIRYLDPQQGRYNDSYLEYIQEYRPEVIVVMYNGEIQL